MNARNRVFLILGLLTVGSLIWYFATVRPTGDLQLIGTVDANEVLVSAKIPGRIQTLTVDEGTDVKAGQLIAVIESQDLQAARKAAEATAAGQQFKLPARNMNDHSGFGLGLSIVRSLVEDVGGGLQLLDHEPHGLIARVTLPRAFAKE